MEFKDNLMSQLVFKFPFKARYNEQDFYVSSNNFSAYKLVESWPLWSSKWVNVYGVTGSGKTHLSKILEKKIDKVQILKSDQINNETITNLNKFDCLIIYNYQNDIEEKLLYSLLNQSKQIESFVLINSLGAIKNLNFGLKDLKSRINSFLPVGIDLPTDDLLHVIITKSFSTDKLN